MDSGSCCAAGSKDRRLLCRRHGPQRGKSCPAVPALDHGSGLRDAGMEGSGDGGGRCGWLLALLGPGGTAGDLLAGLRPGSGAASGKTADRGGIAASDDGAGIADRFGVGPIVSSLFSRYHVGAHLPSANWSGRVRRQII